MNLLVFLFLISCVILIYVLKVLYEMFDEPEDYDYGEDEDEYYEGYYDL